MQLRPLFTRTLPILVFSGLSVLATGVAQAAPPLSYTLSTRLKGTDCRGDVRDQDCLDDARENDLANAINPLLFFDEDEGCPEREAYYQVRPLMAGSSSPFVSSWKPHQGTYRVQVTYYLQYYRDCNARTFEGHTGDGERVQYLLDSSDLQTWTIVDSVYHAHGHANRYSGNYLADRAAELGVRVPSIAADEDGHGSYPGLSGGSDDCGQLQSDPFGLRDCFDDSMAEDFRKGRATRVLDGNSAGRNIGEPFGGWNRDVMGGSGDDAYTWHFNPHTQRWGFEFWSSVGAPYNQFCGWACVSYEGGRCLTQLPGEPRPRFPTPACTGPLWGGVDRSCVAPRNGQWKGDC